MVIKIPITLLILVELSLFSFTFSVFALRPLDLGSLNVTEEGYIPASHALSLDLQNSSLATGNNANIQLFSPPPGCDPRIYPGSTKVPEVSSWMNQIAALAVEVQNPQREFLSKPRAWSGNAWPGSVVDFDLMKGQKVPRECLVHALYKSLDYTLNFPGREAITAIWQDDVKVGWVQIVAKSLPLKDVPNDDIDDVSNDASTSIESIPAAYAMPSVFESTNTTAIPDDTFNTTQADVLVSRTTSTDIDVRFQMTARWTNKASLKGVFAAFSRELLMVALLGPTERVLTMVIEGDAAYRTSFSIENLASTSGKEPSFLYDNLPYVIGKTLTTLLQKVAPVPGMAPSPDTRFSGLDCRLWAMNTNIGHIRVYGI